MENITSRVRDLESKARSYERAFFAMMNHFSNDGVEIFIGTVVRHGEYDVLGEVIAIRDVDLRYVVRFGESDVRLCVKS